MQYAERAFLSDIHWEAIIEAEKEPKRLVNSRASGLWQKGQEIFKTALITSSTQKTNLSEAQSIWRKASLHDPGMADNWLGLIAIVAAQNKTIPSSLAEALALTAARVGQEQERQHSRCRVSFILLFSSCLEIKTPDDARLFAATRAWANGYKEQATRWLVKCQQSPYVDAVQSSLCLDRGNYCQALNLCRRLSLGENKGLKLDGMVGAALSLTALHRPNEAELLLQEALVETNSPRLRRIARYALSGIYRSLGEAYREQAELEILVNEAPDFVQAARRLNELKNRDAEHAWLDLIQRLQGPLANDPNIPDNR